MARWFEGWPATEEERGDRETHARFFYEAIGKKTVEALSRNNFNAKYVASRREAFDTVMGLIPEGASISFGDSVTLYEIGVIHELRSGKYNFLDPWEPGISHDETRERRRRALLVDVFLTGTNAITADGKLMSTDGLGNRVAAMLYGPKKVIVVAGANKIVKDLKEAWNRIRNVAAPMNANRHNFHDIPCGVTGQCLDCRSFHRMCCQTVIIEQDCKWTYTEPRIHIVVVGEQLGF